MASTISQPQKRKLDDGQKYVWACHYNTRKHRSHYITPENEKKLRITIAPLDLSSGDAPDDGPRFIEPVPWDEMNDFVERSRPWERFSDLEPLREDEDVSRDPYASPPELRSAYYCDYQWLTLAYTVPEDISSPHTRASLTDSVPLDHDLLSTGEASVAFGLIKLRRLQNEYNSHRYIPATIFSASNRQIRIIQCWHDKHNPRTLHIRRSQIMDFPDGSRANWKDWITLLCWVAGKPVGDTKGESETVP